MKKERFEQYLVSEGWRKAPQGNDPFSFFYNFERVGIEFQAMMIMGDSSDLPPTFRVVVHPVSNPLQKVTAEFVAQDLPGLLQGLKEFQRRFESQLEWRLKSEKVDHFSAEVEEQEIGARMFAKGVWEVPIIPEAERDNWQPLMKKLGLVIVRKPGRLKNESLALLEKLRSLNVRLAIHFFPPCVLPEDFMPKTRDSVRPRSPNLGGKLVAFETTRRSELPKDRFGHSAREIIDQIIPQVYGGPTSNAITLPSAAEFLWLGKTFYPELDEPESTEWFGDKEAQYLQLYGRLSCINRADHYSCSKDRAYRLLVKLEYELLD